MSASKCHASARDNSAVVAVEQCGSTRFAPYPSNSHLPLLFSLRHLQCLLEMTLPLYMRGSPATGKSSTSVARNPHSGFTLGPAPAPRHQQVQQQQVLLTDNTFCLSCPPTCLSLKDAMALKPHLGKPVSIS
ncbi:hypothetical protein J6590_054279 [Homalodisca vitripennis]|nr:hypothetical protein J6590_054279 [Homalodisca vitripennis]